ncbi:DUF2802 domain-containing protein [Psychrobium sp. 1_MG-2023]|uniref:DUF2802 domain-containing protein n=1 Tax=Psychrobium sp. 1_MG-2023 TaxID=3062624 RepID=UPI000C3364AC|nr:DUF2802 domain-containing protein [Psychrobium sp. 1_MG-2023]MDP2559811.1 DUF2802 domain-containing protein [Psychrobium sp. 1_MG-2023]PKF59083.1 DUF2802 domain-containing protein [Alteromonadales bacterium alter-6D02]
MIEIIAIAALTIAAILGLVIWWVYKRTQRQVCAIKLLFKEQQRQIASFKSELHEMRCGAVGVGSRVQQVEGKLQQAMERQDKLVQQQSSDPQAKLYGQAMKMVELGATVEELMQQCDLPRAEAELLVSLHSQ